MRMHAWENGKRRPGIVAFEGNWHGRTLGAQMLSYNPAQKEWIGYQDPNIHHLPFPYPWREEAMADPRAYFRAGMEALLEERRLDPDQDLCGFMLETFQGWGAVFYPREFVAEVVDFARRHGMLVAFDEMQAGFGRTGKLFGYMHYDVEPDILCCGKGASSGLPLAVVLGSREIMDLPEIGSMSSTHSANPLVCAAGLANLEALFEDGLIENSRILGEIFHARTPGHPGALPGSYPLCPGARSDCRLTVLRCGRQSLVRAVQQYLSGSHAPRAAGRAHRPGVHQAGPAPVHQRSRAPGRA